MRFSKLACAALAVSWVTSAVAQQLTITDPAAVKTWTDLTYGQARSPDDAMGDTEFLLSLSKDELRGAHLFNQHCNACHERDQSIGVSFGPRITKDTMVDRENNNADRSDFVKMQINEGSPNMPAFNKTLNATQVANIMAYLKKAPSPCYDCKIGDFRRAVPITQQ